MKSLLLTSILVSLALQRPAVAGIQPPWPGELSAPTLDRGYNFTVPGVENAPDLHGNPVGAKLVLFIGGNQFMVLPPLIRAFEARNPALRGKIFYETLPPGILQRQMAHGDRLTVGALTLHLRPDVFEAGLKKVQGMVSDGTLVGEPVAYGRNDLVLMVRKGNPKHILNLQDLGRPGVRISMPNPAWEGVARQIEASYRKAGGQALVQRIMREKVANGQTILTEIHHRQTPLNLLLGRADAGVTWRSEALFQEAIGNPISLVNMPASQDTWATYAAAQVQGAPHPTAARRWLAFLTTPQAQDIYAASGFQAVHKAP